MLMKKKSCTFYLLAIILLGIAGCERNDDDIKTGSELPTSLKLTVQEVNDSLIADWQLDKGAVEYFEFKINWQLETGPVQNNRILLDGDKNRYAQLKFGDIPLKSYKVIGYLSSGDSVVSNVIETYKPDLYPIQLRAFDALYNQEDSLVYLFSKDGILVSYNLNRKRVVAFNVFGKGINFTDFGTYGGNKELYLPSEDGNLYIMDGKTLELKDQITVGNPLFSAAAAGDYLFLSTGAYGSAIKVYSRSQKRYLGSGGLFGNTRLKTISSAKTELLDITPSYNTIQQATSYTLNAAGELIIKGEQKYPYQGWGINGNLIYPYQDGSKIILSNAGMILNNNLQLERKLSTVGDKYIAFCHNSQTQLLYAAYSATPRIDVFTADGAGLNKTIETALYPRWLFNVGAKIIMLGSKTSPGRLGLGVIPEKLYVEEVQ